MPEQPAGSRPYRAEDATGVLRPANLARYEAGWVPASPTIAEIVDQCWHVRWHLDPGETIEQAIVDLPAVTVSVERGAVPHPLVVTGVHTGPWRREIRGAGEVFAVRLRPAGLRALSDLDPASLVDRTLPLTASVDARLHALAAEVAAHEGVEARTAAVERAVERALAERPVTAPGALANRALDALRGAAGRLGLSPLADGLGTSERSVQRALAATLGVGPKHVAQRLRLQAVAQSLAAGDDDLATVAAAHGYADQAHLTNDFRRTAGIAPGAYRRSLGALLG